jgi:hypothetical protein
MLRGCAGFGFLRHHRSGDEDGDAGLAHRDHMGARPDGLEKIDDVLDVFVEAEPAVRPRDVADIVPVGDVDVVIGEQRAHGRAQQRREMSRQRRHQQHARLRGIDILLEVQQRSERRDPCRLLVHRDFLVAHHRAVDVEGWPVVSETGARDQLIGSREIARERGDAGRLGRRHRLYGETRQCAHRNHEIGMCLIGEIKH